MQMLPGLEAVSFNHRAVSAINIIIIILTRLEWTEYTAGDNYAFPNCECIRQVDFGAGCVDKEIMALVYYLRN